MDDVSKLGPLWVSQLSKEVAARRNRAAESLMTVYPDGSYAEQHRILIEAANVMLAAPDMLQALRRAVLALAFAAESSSAMRDDYNAVSAAIAKATGSAS